MAYVGIIYQTETSMKGSSNMYLEIEKYMEERFWIPEEIQP